MDLTHDRLADGGPRYTETPAEPDAPDARFPAEPWNAVTASLFVVVALAWLVRLRGRYRGYPFLMSCLAHSDDPAVRAAAAGRLAELTGKQLPSPPPADREQRLKLVEELRKSIDAGGAAR